MKAYRKELHSYDPSLKQAKAHQDPAKFRLCLGAWGAGKSAFMIWESIAMGLIDCPGALIVFFRKTGPALRDTTLQMFRELLPWELVKKEVRSEGSEEIILHNGTRYWFRALDDWRKLGSTAFDGIFVDEADEITQTDFRTLRGRLRGPVGPRKMVLATNPPDISHWLYKAFVKEPLVGTSVHHFSMWDNESHLPPGYIEDALSNLTPREQRKYVHGLWGFLGEGDPVYEVRDELHLAILNPVKGLPIYRGWDFGFRHPFCGMGQKLSDGHVNVLQDVLRTNMDLAIFCEIVKQVTSERFPGFQVVDFCDIAGKQKRETGVNAIGILHDHDIWPLFRKLPLMKSIKHIRYLLRTLHMGRPLLMFDSKYAMLSYEAFSGGYQWNPKTDEPLKDPESFYDDVADGDRYWICPATQSALISPQRPLPARVAV